jgi:microcystin-dependent protein
VPTIHEEGGFKVRVLNKDHFPAHVHVLKAGTYAKIRISSYPVVYETNMTKRDADAARTIVIAQLELCRKKWIERYGSLTLLAGDQTP